MIHKNKIPSVFMVVLFMATLMFSNSVMATPDVGNVVGGPSFSDGDNVVFTGVAFGAKSIAQPLLWDNFNNGTNGAELTSTGTWRVDSDNVAALRPKFDNGSQRDGVGLNAFFNYPPVSAGTYQRDMMFYQGLGIGRGEKVFLSVWIQSSYPGPDQPSSKQWKIMRLSEGPYDTDTYPDVYFDYNRNGFYAAYRDGVGNISTSCMSWPTQTDYMPHPTVNTWFNFMIEASVETGVGNCDGRAKIWFNGQLEMNIDEAKALFDESDFGWDEAWFGEYIQDNTRGYTARFDDIYIDNSWARVEIGNASNYGACTHREIQIPTNWTSSQISFIANQGSFTTGSDLYLFVVDENGIPSDGHLVQFGGGQDDQILPTISISGTETVNVGYPQYINVTGVASDNQTITSVTWVNSLGGSGFASGTTFWTVNNIQLHDGLNNITFTVHDGAGNSENVNIAINWTFPSEPGPVNRTSQ